MKNISIILAIAVVLSGCASKDYTKTMIFDYNDYYSINSDEIESSLIVKSKNAFTGVTFYTEGSCRYIPPTPSDKYVIEEEFSSYNPVQDILEPFSAVVLIVPALWLGVTMPLAGGMADGSIMQNQMKDYPVKQSILQNYAMNIDAFAL